MAYEKIDEGGEVDTFHTLIENIYSYHKNGADSVKDRLTIEKVIKKQFKKERPDWVLNLILEVLNKYDNNNANRTEEKTAK